MDEQKIHGASLAAVVTAGSIAPDAAPHDAKHTPGPWEARWECSAICVGEQTLARIYWDEGRSAAENCANAHLIAAAPELLAVAKEARRIHVCCCGPRDVSPCLRCTAHAAIAKAEGKV